MRPEGLTVRIPTRLNCTTAAYRALGLTELGTAPREYGDDPLYLYSLVRLPVGWTYILDSDYGHMLDDRGIQVAVTDDNHILHDRKAWTAAVQVGRDAAGALYGDDGTLEQIRFELLTDKEVADLEAELARMAAETFEGYAEEAAKARLWQDVLQGALAARSIYRGYAPLDPALLSGMREETIEDLVEELERVGQMTTLPQNMAAAVQYGLGVLANYFAEQGST